MFSRRAIYRFPFYWGLLASEAEDDRSIRRSHGVGEGKQNHVNKNFFRLFPFSFFHELYSMRNLLILIGFLLVVSASAQEPSDFSGLQLWVKSDAGIVTNENSQLEVWQDQSGNFNNLVQNSNGFKPLFVEDVLNEWPAIRFDGTDDRMDFGELTDIRTVFWVIKEDADAGDDRVPLLCHSTLFDFHRETEYILWHPTFSNEAIRNGTTRLNGVDVIGEETALPPTFSLVSLVTEGDVAANRFSFDRTFGTRMWDGDLLELIIYNEPLTPEEVSSIEDYLFAKYTPAFVLTQDTEVAYGLCETELFVMEGFESYEWSTGEESTSISVNESGDYWVEVTDVFGRVIRDTVSVTYPGNLVPPSSNMVCLGDSVLWDTELNDETYAFDWGNGNTSSSNWFGAEGAYELTVTDDDGCSFTTAIFDVSIDAFSANTTLGEDVELCAGNTISLMGEGILESTILWQDDQLIPEFEVVESGEYWVEAANENGCIAQDTIFVDIIGTAPEIAMLLPSVICQNTQQEYNGSASADSPITEWNWTFPGGEELAGQVVEYTAEGFGLQTFSLEVVSESGCSDELSQEVQVYPAPSGNINVSAACEGNPLILSTTPQVPEGGIFTVEWFFEGQTTEGVVAEFIPADAGFSEVELIFTTLAGCTSQVDQLVNVLPSPLVSLEVPITCLGELTVPSASIDDNGAGGIDTYAWFFGDNTTSSQASPQHLYTSAQTYFMELQVTGVNGCYAIADATAEVIEPPVADFTVTNACLDTPYLLISASTAGTDAIALWDWEVETLGEVQGEVAEVTFDDTGFFEVNLEVISENGCSDEVTAQVPVFELPSPDFSFTPAVGLPPLEVTFTNLTPEAESYTWDFGDSQTSTFFEPVHDYMNEGTFTITLTATNIYGCQASVSQSIDLVEPILDLSIEQLAVDQTDFGLVTTLAIANNGNYTVEQAEVALQLGNGGAAGELLAINLTPGESGIFTLTTQLQPTETTDQYVCAEINAFSSLALEATPENNQYCDGFGTTFEMAAVFPNPTVSGAVINLRAMAISPEEAVVSLYDQQGKKVLETEPLQLNEGYNNIELQLPELQVGTYTLEFIGDQHQATQVLLLVD